ncbi:MAG: phospholipase, partial [Actinomycetota bacterium]
MNRRTLIKGAGVGLGLSAISTPASAANVLQVMLGRAGIIKPNTRTPIKHLVVVMMENRSTDHYLGWYGAENPNFDGTQHAQVPDLRVPGNPLVSTDNWGQHGRNSMHGRGFRDPSHGWTGGRYEFNGGNNDGWLDPRTNNDEFALSYYDAEDVPIWAQLARGYQTYDRWHCSLMGPTQPNRYYMHSGQAGGLKNNDLPPQYVAQGGHPNWRFGWDWPTIWTLLDNAGVSSAYYFSNLPVLAYWGPRH